MNVLYSFQDKLADDSSAFNDKQIPSYSRTLWSRCLQNQDTDTCHLGLGFVFGSALLSSNS